MGQLASEGIARGLEFDNMFVSGLLDGFGNDDYFKRFDGAQCAAWLIGHLAHSRRQMGSIIDATQPLDGWEQMFGQSCDSGDPSDAWPAPSDLLGEFLSTGHLLAEQVRRLGEADLVQLVDDILGESKIPVAYNLQFMIHHEAYHVGQIGYIRSMLGLPYLA